MIPKRSHIMYRNDHFSVLRLPISGGALMGQRAGTPISGGALMGQHNHPHLGWCSHERIYKTKDQADYVSWRSTFRLVKYIVSGRFTTLFFFFFVKNKFSCLRCRVPTAKTSADALIKARTPNHSPPLPTCGHVPCKVQHFCRRYLVPPLPVPRLEVVLNPTLPRTHACPAF